tara:strand:- start:428 stop:589 length:162 start_codon:yes stop_codon:yes gene_type:complete
MTKINYIAVLDYMAVHEWGEFGFSSCSPYEQNDILRKFMKTPSFYINRYNNEN